MPKLSSGSVSYVGLSFEERQRRWKGELREFRQHHGRGERESVWEIWVVGDRVFSRFGLLGGAQQVTSYVGKTKNEGRSNEVTTEEDALAEARRDVRKKWEYEGYDEYEDGANIDSRNNGLSVQALLTNLPGSFCLYKPENNLYDQKKLLSKAKEGKVWYTFKRDGVAKLIVVDYYGEVRIYSRRARAWQDKEGPTELPDGTLDYSTMIPWAARFPHLIEAVKDLNLPKGTMMATELVARNKDNFPYISGLTKGYTQRALDDMKANGFPILYWWDLPFFGGEDLVSTVPFKQRVFLLQQLIMQGGKTALENIQPLNYSTNGAFASPEAAVDYAKSIGAEGFVVVDPDSIYGDKGWNLKGKPDRPSMCAKLKPAYEDDFVVMWDPDRDTSSTRTLGEWGTGDNEANKIVKLPDGRMVKHGGVGSVGLWQYNAAGELIFICKCASGMDYTFQASLTPADFPAVWEVRYNERTYVSEGDKTNALKFPRVLRVRDDKAMAECINTRL
jgi:ATP-dependent DNA ligase